MSIKNSEHVFIAGSTGSGKTFLALAYLAYNPSKVVILDTKGLIDWDVDHVVVTTFNELVRTVHNKIIYRPVHWELNFEAYDRFFKWIYNHGNIICCVDEVMSVIPNANKIPTWYNAIMTRGRQLNVSMWNLAQRPSRIALVAMSEATHLFIFRLNMPDDRKRLVEITGYDEFDEIPEQYYFWYCNTAAGENPRMGILK